MWIAATPVVAWGGPMGSFIAARMKARHLVFLAISLAVAEILSTAIFLEELHRPTWLLVYAIVGMGILVTGLYLLAKYRRVVFGLPGLSLEDSLSRGNLDVVTGYEQQIDHDPRRGGADETDR
jgi:hypothetical protein